MGLGNINNAFRGPADNAADYSPMAIILSALFVFQVWFHPRILFFLLSIILAIPTLLGVASMFHHPLSGLTLLGPIALWFCVCLTTIRFHSEERLQVEAQQDPPN
jgi:uncharacterized membrane protein YecN with MAPEG domain